MPGKALVEAGLQGTAAALALVGTASAPRQRLEPGNAGGDRLATGHQNPGPLSQT